MQVHLTGCTCESPTSPGGKKGKHNIARDQNPNPNYWPFRILTVPSLFTGLVRMRSVECPQEFLVQDMFTWNPQSLIQAISFPVNQELPRTSRMCQTMCVAPPGLGAALNASSPAASPPPARLQLPQLMTEKGSKQHQVQRNPEGTGRTMHQALCSSNRDGW